MYTFTHSTNLKVWAQTSLQGNHLHDGAEIGHNGKRRKIVRVHNLDTCDNQHTPQTCVLELKEDLPAVFEGANSGANNNIAGPFAWF